jgi:ABC-type bacteriocin/lantibiotic exporter with double-glycine peptidase domain
MDSALRPAPPPPSLRRAAVYFTRLVRLLRPYWFPLGEGIALGLVASLVGVAVPYLTKLLIDRVYPTHDVSLMHVLVGALLALGAASAVILALRSIYSSQVRVRLGAATHLLFFNHIQHLPMRFFDRHQVGELTSRFNDVSRGVNSLGQVMEVVVTQGLFVLLVPPLLFVLDVRLALLALGAAPLLAAIAAANSRRLRRLWKRSSLAYADLGAYQVEVLSHIRTFKGMALERRAFAEARRREVAAGEAQLRAATTGQALSGLSALVRAVSTAALAWVGWTLILDGRLSLGGFIAFTGYVGYLYGPLFAVIQLFSDFQESAVYLERMFEILDTAPEQEPSLSCSPLPPPALELAGEYRLRDVTLTYGGETPALAGIDLDLPAGAVTAVIGPSGAGKTSLLRLLAALELPDRGAIALDGRPMGGLPLADVRRQIAVVWQGDSLLRGTLWENLTLGCAIEPSLERVDRMVELCGLGELVAELPDGYRSEVAEWGASLSAGQQQRVAIARALLRDARILILDEATANVDVETEQRILEGVLDHWRGRTLVFVTHRLATAALADRVAVLERGRLVGVGSHRDLLVSCVPYRRMQSAAGGSESRSLRASLVAEG